MTSLLQFAIFMVTFIALIFTGSTFALSTLTQFGLGRFPGGVALFRILFLILPLIFIATTLIGNFVYNRFVALAYSISALWIPILLYLTLGSILIWLGYFLGKLIHIPGLTAIIFSLVVIGVGISMVLGITNALSPKTVTYNISAPLLQEKWSNKKIVLFSDSHFGLVRNKRFAQKIVRMINELHPDIVFIAGDLIDGPIIPYEETLKPLADIKSTFGVFYTAGNHDEYNREQTEYYQALNKYVTVLNDKQVVVNDTQVTGIIYAHETEKKTQERLLATGFDKTIPSIVMLHDPKNVNALKDAGVTLSLSGHTHGGQFFPITLIVKGIYSKLRKGVNYLGSMTQFTTVGVGTAGPLFRLGTQPEIVILKIQ